MDQISHSSRSRASLSWKGWRQWKEERLSEFLDFIGMDHSCYCFKLLKFFMNSYSEEWPEIYLSIQKSSGLHSQFPKGGEGHFLSFNRPVFCPKPWEWSPQSLFLAQASLKYFQYLCMCHLPVWKSQYPQSAWRTFLFFDKHGDLFFITIGKAVIKI